MIKYLLRIENCLKYNVVVITNRIQIRISYIDVLQTTRDRRSELQSRYYFWCRCKRCEESEPMAEAAACPNKFCTYPCSPDADACESCNTKFPEDFKEIFDEISDFTADNLDNMRDIACILFMNNIH